MQVQHVLPVADVAVARAAATSMSMGANGRSSSVSKFMLSDCQFEYLRQIPNTYRILEILVLNDVPLARYVGDVFNLPNFHRIHFRVEHAQVRPYLATFINWGSTDDCSTKLRTDPHS